MRNLWCVFNRHDWGLWSHDTTAVPLMKFTNLGSTQVGWTYVAIAGPDYRRCKRCPVIEQRGSVRPVA
jgi:hypothetical protein